MRKNYNAHSLFNIETKLYLRLPEVGLKKPRNKRVFQEAAMDGKSNKSRFELIVELIKAVVWPVFALVILISFWQPLHLAVDQLPEVVSRSDTITIAGLSLKIDRSLQLQGKEPSLAVKKALAGLAPEDVSALLKFGESTCYPASSILAYKTVSARLIDLGLLMEIPVTTFGNPPPECGYALEITDLGKETQQYLHALITEFVQQLNTASSNPVSGATQNP